MGLVRDNGIANFPCKHNMVTLVQYSRSTSSWLPIGDHLLLHWKRDWNSGMDDEIFQMTILQTVCWLICTLSSLSYLWSPLYHRKGYSLHTGCGLGSLACAFWCIRLQGCLKAGQYKPELVQQLVTPTCGKVQKLYSRKSSCSIWILLKIDFSKSWLLVGESTFKLSSNSLMHKASTNVRRNAICYPDSALQTSPSLSSMGIEMKFPWQQQPARQTQKSRWSDQNTHILDSILPEWDLL